MATAPYAEETGSESGDAITAVVEQAYAIQDEIAEVLSAESQPGRWALGLNTDQTGNNAESVTFAWCIYRPDATEISSVTCYASSGEVGDGFQIYRIDLKDFSTRLYFSTGSDNMATFWGLFDHEPTVDELLADVGSVTSFVVDGNYIYYLQGGRLYKVFRWTGWETVEVTNTAQVQSIKFLDGKIVCEK